MSNDKSKQDYINIELKVKEDIDKYLINHNKTMDANQLAKIHIKNNINWYRTKYKDVQSSSRNKHIVNDVVSKFTNVDTKDLSLYLIRFGIFTLLQYIMIYIMLSITILFVLYLNNIVHGHIIGGYLISCLIIGYFSALIYDVSSFIKFYYTRKLK